MARPLSRDDEGLGTFGSFVGVLLLVAAILGVYYGVIVPKFGAPPLRAQSGDIVRVDYVGSFADNGLVFDTSIASVGSDNASYPKAFTFAWRQSWQPLSFTIGTGGVIRGFDLGVEGLAVGDAKTIVVPPELGYGTEDPSKFVVKPLFETVAVRLIMSAEDFGVKYGVAPRSGLTVTDPFWGWPAYVSVAGSYVTVRNSPTPDQLVQPYGAWDAEVVSIDEAANDGEGAIVVHHRLDTSSVDRVGLASTTADGQRVVTFVVSAVDPAAGTYTLNYDVSPPVGRTLVFQVTMVSISRPF